MYQSTTIVCPVGALELPYVDVFGDVMLTARSVRPWTVADQVGYKLRVDQAYLLHVLFFYLSRTRFVLECAGFKHFEHSCANLAVTLGVHSFIV
jgi:hypothetical protein